MDSGLFSDIGFCDYPTSEYQKPAGTRDLVHKYISVCRSEPMTYETSMYVCRYVGYVDAFQRNIYFFTYLYIYI